jgi:hypothetical protein
MRGRDCRVPNALQDCRSDLVPASGGGGATGLAIGRSALSAAPFAVTAAVEASVIADREKQLGAGDMGGAPRNTIASDRFDHIPADHPSGLADNRQTVSQTRTEASKDIWTILPPKVW